MEFSTSGETLGLLQTSLTDHSSLHEANLQVLLLTALTNKIYFF